VLLILLGLAMNTCACGVLLLLALVERCLAPEWAVFNQRSIGLTVGRAHTCTFFLDHGLWGSVRSS
jgi:hypothetical protein